MRFSRIYYCPVNTLKSKDRKRMNNPLWEDILDFHKNRQLLGIVLVVLGAAGLLLPILPGLLVIILGLALLAPDKVGSVLNWLRNKSAEEPDKD